MGNPPVSSRSSARSRRPVRCTSGSATGAKCCPSRTRRCGTRAPGAWIAASRSVIRAAPSATSSPTGTIWSTGSGGRRRASRLHATNNFPVDRWLCPAPCGAPACSASTTTRSPSSRSSCRLSSTRSTADGFGRDRRPCDRKASGGRRLWSGRPRRGRRTQQGRPPGHGFERADRIGGLLRYGIPEFKLEKRFIDRRLAIMSAEGVEFRTGVEIGIDLPVAGLRRQFDAIVLCCGTPWARTSRFRVASSAVCTSPSST